MLKRGAISCSVCGLSLGEPVPEAALHGLAAGPAACVHRGDDLQRAQPLHKALHLQEAAVLAVGHSWKKKETICFFFTVHFKIEIYFFFL